MKLIKIASVTIAGNVYLSGNNNSLSRVRVKGEIVSNGNNNTW